MSLIIALNIIIQVFLNVMISEKKEKGRKISLISKGYPLGAPLVICKNLINPYF